MTQIINDLRSTSFKIGSVSLGLCAYQLNAARGPAASPNQYPYTNHAVRVRFFGPPSAEMLLGYPVMFSPAITVGIAPVLIQPRCYPGIMYRRRISGLDDAFPEGTAERALIIWVSRRPNGYIG